MTAGKLINKVDWEKQIDTKYLEKKYTVYAISRQPKWYNNGLRMKEKSLESTEIFKIFRGSIPPYPPTPPPPHTHPASLAFGARYFALNILYLRTLFNETQLRAC